MDDNPLGTFLHTNKSGKIIFDNIVQTWAAKLAIDNLEILGFSANQIVREISFGHFEVTKNSLFSIGSALNFEFL